MAELNVRTFEKQFIETQQFQTVEEHLSVHARVNLFAHGLQFVIEDIAVGSGAHFQKSYGGAEIIEWLPGILIILCGEEHLEALEYRSFQILEDAPYAELHLPEFQLVSER